MEQGGEHVPLGSPGNVEGANPGDRTTVREGPQEQGRRALSPHAPAPAPAHDRAALPPGQAAAARRGGG